jgi:hypothetical protein
MLFILISIVTITIITLIILDINSTYESKHAIFGFLSLAPLAHHDNLQFIHCFCKWHISFSFHSFLWLTKTPLCIAHNLYPFINCWGPRLITQIGYCEQCCDKHGCAGLSIVCWFTVLWLYVKG